MTMRVSNVDSGLAFIYQLISGVGVVVNFLLCAVCAFSSKQLYNKPWYQASASIKWAMSAWIVGAMFCCMDLLFLTDTIISWPNSSKNFQCDVTATITDSLRMLLIVTRFVAILQRQCEALQATTFRYSNKALIITRIVLFVPLCSFGIAAGSLQTYEIYRTKDDPNSHICLQSISRSTQATVAFAVFAAWIFVVPIIILGLVSYKLRQVCGNNKFVFFPCSPINIRIC